MFTHTELLNETTGLGKFALKLTRNSADADDLLQSSLLTALDKQSQFEQGTNLFSWISRIMFNTFISNYRRNIHLDTQFDPQIYIDQKFVEGTQETEVELDLVGEAMSALSEDHQQILKMVCIEGMQYNEVAEALRIPVGTVRSRLFRARSGLEEKLKVGRRNRIFSTVSTGPDASISSGAPRSVAQNPPAEVSLAVIKRPATAHYAVAI
jgi:RNA polymerase sigma-70 factor (ECF subfamily)